MKKIIILILIFTLLTLSYSFADVNYNSEAEKLKEIGVFKGTGDGFELDRAPTRLEGAAMFVRLLGGDAEAKEANYPHPFTDVPNWGNPYVGYLYHYNLANGVGNNKFGSGDIMIAKSYLTFMLRSLNYNDSKGDFSWNFATEKSNEIGLISDDFLSDLNETAFLRDHVALISYNTLKQTIKGEDMSLSEKLVLDGAFSEDAAIAMGVISSKINNLFSEGSPLVKLTEDDIKALGADGFTGTDLEIANQIKDWQVENMIYASSSEDYPDVSYSMRWDYAFPGIYTVEDMINNMKDGNKIYGICFNYAVIFADIADYYNLDVRIMNTTIKPSEINDSPFYKATATGLAPDEYAEFKNWIISKDLNIEDYPYEAVRLVMAETALHYRAEVKIDDEWIALDTYRPENVSANEYTFVETDWQEGNQEETFNEYVERIKNGEDLKGDEDVYQAYNGFLEGMLLLLGTDELENYVGVTDDLGQKKRAATQDDLFQGYGLVPYYNNKNDVLDYMSDLDWLEEEIDEFMEIKTSLENELGINFYVIVSILLTQEDDSILPYDVYMEQYLGYTGDDISTVVTEKIYNSYME
ncbi:MAG: hypothetical protein J7L15_04050 [Clostridiales bacterium]|nr:hypothetical protein [Clostridiales bacterium]